MVEVIFSIVFVFIGSYSEWINCYFGYFNCVIFFILQGFQGLQNSEIVELVIMLFKDVIGENLDYI